MKVEGDTRPEAPARSEPGGQGVSFMARAGLAGPLSVVADIVRRFGLTSLQPRRAGPAAA